MVDTGSGGATRSSSSATGVGEAAHVHKKLASSVKAAKASIWEDDVMAKKRKAKVSRSSVS